jgi:hypothetical protein
VVEFFSCTFGQDTGFMRKFANAMGVRVSARTGLRSPLVDSLIPGEQVEVAPGAATDE